MTGFLHTDENGAGQSSPSPAPELHLGRAIRRHLVIVVAVLVVLPLLAVLLLAGRPPAYTSTATVFLRPTTGNALSPDSAKNSQQVTVAMETEAGLVNGPGVATLASAKLRRAVTAGAADITATVAPNTQIVQIQYSTSSAELARQGAQAYAEAFLDSRKAVSEANNKRQLDLLKAQATSVSANLKSVSDDAASDTPSPDSAALVQLNTNRLSSLQEQIGQLSTTDTNPGSVVTPATVPAGASGLNPLLVVGAAVALALLLAVSLAVWRERADDRIRADDDDEIAGVTFLASLSTARAAGPADDRERLALGNAYRQARAALLVAAPMPSVLLISPADDNGRTEMGTIAANLAASFESASYRVCILDLAGAGPEAVQVLGAPGPPGPALSADAFDDPAEIIAGLPKVRNVSLLAAGQLPTHDAGLFVSVRFQDLVSRLRSWFDLVLITAPPVLTPRGTELALAADSVVLVVADRRTTYAGVAEVVAHQQRMRVPVVGLVSLKSTGQGSDTRLPTHSRTPTGPPTQLPAAEEFAFAPRPDRTGRP